MSDFVRILPATPTPNQKPDDRGWRLRLVREDEENAHLYEEQVLPERVLRPDANRILAQNEITLTELEARWLRSQLAEAFGQIDDTEALIAEVLRLRSGETVRLCIEALARIAGATGGWETRVLYCQRTARELLQQMPNAGEVAP